MEHTVHLAAKAFIEAVSPNKSKKATVEDTNDADDADDNDGDSKDDEDWTADWADIENVLDGVDIDPAIEFLPGDILSKVLTLINQVS